MDVDKSDNEDGAYDAEEDPDAEPEMIQQNRLRPQPNQAEGADDPAETGEPAAEEPGE